jgi:hypothetical protein
MSGQINVRVEARRTQRGHVECKIRCNGQHAVVIFTGHDVITEVMEEAADGQREEIPEK